MVISDKQTNYFFFKVHCTIQFIRINLWMCVLETEKEPLHETDDEGIETDSGVGEYEESSSMPRSCTPSYDRNGQPFLLTHIIKVISWRF